MTTYLLGSYDAVFVTDEDGTTSVSPGVPVVGLEGSEANLLAPDLVTDVDGFFLHSGVDPYWDNVVLLTGGNVSRGGPAAADGSTTFIDESASGKTLTAGGNAQIVTVESKFGGSSLLFDGTGDFVSAADSPDWSFGSAAFTLELWLRWAVTPPSSSQELVAQYYSAGNQRSWIIDYTKPNLLLRLATIGSLGVTKITAAFTPVIGTWYHIAADWDGTTYRLYIDGAMVGSATGVISLFNSSAQLTIGAQQDGTFPFDGHIDEVRVTKGVARYASDAGFAAPTAEFARALGDFFFLPAPVVDDDIFYGPSIPFLLGGALVADDDTFYAPAFSYGFLLPSLADDADTIASPSVASIATLLPALHDTDDSVFATAIATAVSQTLLPTRVTDDDVIHAPAVAAVAAGIQTLLPGLVTVGETFPVPSVGTAATRTLRPPLVSAGEAVYPAYSIDTAKPPKQRTLRAGRVNDVDVFYRPAFSLPSIFLIDADVIYAPIGIIYYPLGAAFIPADDSIPSPFVAMQGMVGLVPADDAIYAPGISLFLVPGFETGDDIIPAADVGWRVFAGFTADADAITATHVQALNALLPEVWADEETMDTYPFFIQQLEGGIPVPGRVDLVGSVSSARRLTGTTTSQIRLKGSISGRHELIGSMKHR